MKAQFTFQVRKVEEVQTMSRGPSSMWREMIDTLQSYGSDACLELSTRLTKTQGSALRMSAKERGLRLTIATSADGQRSIVYIAKEKHSGQGQDA